MNQNNLDWPEKEKLLQSAASAMMENSRKAIWNIEKARNFDFAFVIALTEEFRYFKKVMGSMQRLSDFRTGQIYYTFQCGDFRCAVLLLGRMGKVTSAQMVERMLNRYNVGTIVSIGTAGSVKPDDIKVGDVVVASRVSDFFHRSKVEDPPSEKEEMDFTIYSGGSSYQTTQQLVSWVMHLEFSHPQIYEKWKRSSDDKAEELLKNIAVPSGLDQKMAVTLKKAKECLSNVQLHAEDIHIATLDMVAASKKFANWIKTKDRNISVIEMESSGVQQLPL